ncbi:MAG TPA: protein-tyrosine phosphatase family protein [Pseudonocardiaceae bacterium]|jgi:hypothetical protein|nr:protein-tyrosine phosphatase family protein [Pseudonocardiaceae bacterium]
MTADRLTGAIVLPDGTAVRGRGRREPLPPGPLPSYGLYLGRSPDTPPSRLVWFREALWRPDWPADWIDWPDFAAPRDSATAAALIQHAYQLARAGQRVEVACRGGTGRTGTVIACMAILAGHPADDALTWTRRHYRPRAVETRSQRHWITWFATHHSEAGADRPRW